MFSLIAACTLFVGIHIFVSGSPLRGRLVAVVGERIYQGGFSLASAGALIWMALAYRTADYVPLWTAPAGLRHLAALLMLLALVLVVAGLSAPNPTSAGQRIDADNPARGMTRVTRHPFLNGVAIWGLAHLMVNGHLAALMLFGSLTVLAIAGPHLIDAKLKARAPQAWLKLADATSWLPFVAILQKRNRLVLGEIGWWRPLLALAIWALLLFWAHGFIFGLDPLAM
ncbi:MAG: NnrU family protein [Alphaproteobacteria bacterium]